MRKLMKENLPSSIKVGPFEYQIIQWTTLEATAKEAYGDCDRVQMMIHLRGDLPRQKKAETLLHEVMHAAWGATNAHLAPMDEESIVSMLATQMLQVMRDNPFLVAWLCEE